MKIIRTHVYAKRAKKLLSEQEIIAAEHEILHAPEAWPIVSGSGGIRKSRAAKGNTGKRGGVRIIYYYMATATRIYLLDIYAKNEQDTITDASKKMFRSMVKILNEENAS
jgi:hypothetical protein